MMTLSELHARIEREQAYFAGRGARLECRLWPPADLSTLDALSNDLDIRLPTAYSAFLSISNGIWLKLMLPATDESDGLLPENSAGLHESDVVLRASRSVRDLMEWIGFTESSRVIVIGQDGMIGDNIVLWSGADAARVVACTNDEPGRLLESRFALAPSFEEFLERLLGASQEGREKITFWME